MNSQASKNMVRKYVLEQDKKKKYSLLDTTFPHGHNPANGAFSPNYIDYIDILLY